MNKRELIEALEESFNDEEQVYFAFPYGDYAGHVCIVPVNSVEELSVGYSAYTGTFVEELDGDRAVVVLVN